jgi:hypothetical protein
VCEVLGCDESVPSHKLLAESSELLLQASKGVPFPDATHVCECEKCKNLKGKVSSEEAAYDKQARLTLKAVKPSMINKSRQWWEYVMLNWESIYWFVVR